MSEQTTRAYWKFSACIVVSLAISMVGYWTSSHSLTVEQWRGVVCFFFFVFLCMVIRSRVFESQVFFFDVEYPPHLVKNKTIVVFGRSVPDVLVENKEKSILFELMPTRFQSASARLAGVFSIVCAIFILTFFNMMSGYAILTSICLFFTLFGSPFLKQLWWLVFVSAGVGFWSFQKIEFEQAPEYLLLVMAFVGTLIAASQYLRVIELSKINELSKALENSKNDWRVCKDATWMAVLFVLSVWVVQSWIPHRNPDPDRIVPPSPPKLISPKLSRSIAERLAGLEGRMSGGSAQGGGGSAQGGGGSGVPSPEPLSTKNNETGTPSSITEKSNGESADSSIGGSGQQGNAETASSSQSEKLGSNQNVGPGKSSGQSPSQTKSLTDSSQQPDVDLKQKKEERIKRWQNRLERILSSFKSAVVVVAIVIAAVVLLLFFKDKSKGEESKKRAKYHMLEEVDKARLKRIFQLIQSRKIGERQEVIETYNAVLEVLDTAQYARDPWNPVEDYSLDIANQIRPIGKEFQSLTETFSDVLYGQKEVEQPRLQEFRQNVTGILKYFRL